MSACLAVNPQRPVIDLAELLADRLKIAPLAVTGLTLDSRRVSAGDAFVALPGALAHGLSFAPAACAQGVQVVLVDASDAHSGVALPAHVQVLKVPHLMRDLAELANRAYGYPSRQLSITGITGTNGKTTTAWLLASAYQALGQSAGYIGTLGSGLLNHLSAPTHTTPDVITLQQNLAGIQAAGATTVAMEVSSQGLAQSRTDAIGIKRAGFTNLTRDHLDYHGTLEAYGAAKARLFVGSDLQQAVINVADAFGEQLAGSLRSDIQLIAVQPSDDRYPNFVRARSIKPQWDGLVIEGESHLGAFTLHSSLIGLFNVENLLVALGLLLADGLALADAVRALQQAKAPPGRMEVWRLANNAVVVVDYAHTPDALEKALQSLCQHAQAQLWCVFGCGGDRDPGKRPLMGAVAERLADRVVVTDDNPRGEDSQAIWADIDRGFLEPARVLHESDRAQAIGLAIAHSKAGDVILVAGMGHETCQIRAGVSRAYSDRDTVASFAAGSP